MKKMINYPNGKVVKSLQKVKEKNLNKSHLGVEFENLINEANQYYLKNNVACIYKKPTPIQVVKVDYPKRNKAKIIEAYYKLPSTTDYNGIYQGYYIDFEAKSCHGESFPFSHLYIHQIKHLEKVMNMGGIAFLIIKFFKVNETYILLAKNLIELYNQSLEGGRKSIPYNYFKSNAYKVESTKNLRIDYLDAIKKYLEMNRK